MAAPMRLVIDTNVLVSALLNEGRVPDLALQRIRSRGDVVLYDGRILEEYRSVLARPKFARIDAARRDQLISALVATGAEVRADQPFEGAMIDHDDRKFVEVAIAGRADVLLTGNDRHYPRTLAFEVMGPTALLGILEGDLTEPARSGE